MNFNIKLYSIKSERRFLWFIVLLIQVGCLFSQKLNTIEEVSAKLQHCKADTTRVNLLIELSLIWDLTDHGKSFNAAAEALSIAQKINYKKGMAEALNNMGSSAQGLAEYSQALNYYKQLEDSAVKWNIPFFKMTAKLNTANLYRNKGDFSNASQLYFEALKWSEAENNILFRAITENNLGMLYERQ
ncbi:MAG TPA: hypothetical protein PLC65_12380, partial [Bacteroidia bacterium]|nr:hypothetical protein [Bacteroidia bacterium]